MNVIKAIIILVVSILTSRKIIPNVRNLLRNMGLLIKYKDLKFIKYVKRKSLPNLSTHLSSSDVWREAHPAMTIPLMDKVSPFYWSIFSSWHSDYNSKSNVLLQKIFQIHLQILSTIIINCKILLRCTIFK